MNVSKLTSEVEKLDEKWHYHSRFNFLAQHMGVRPNKLHLLMGTTGSGKSTVVKSIIADASKDAKILVYLTEEKKEEYAQVLDKLGYNRDNVSFFEELSIPAKMDYRSKLFVIREAIIASEAQILVFDNVTTSALYEGTHQTQNAFIDQLCSFAADRSVFCVAHTNKVFKDNGGQLMTSSDIRGSARLPLKAQFLYCLQVMQVGETKFPVLRIEKHRGWELKNYFFLLGYEHGVYKFDQIIDFAYVKQIFKKRNKL